VKNRITLVVLFLLSVILLAGCNGANDETLVGTWEGINLNNDAIIEVMLFNEDGTGEAWSESPRYNILSGGSWIPFTFEWEAVDGEIFFVKFRNDVVLNIVASYRFRRGEFLITYPHFSEMTYTRRID